MNKKRITKHAKNPNTQYKSSLWSNPIISSNSNFNNSYNDIEDIKIIGKRIN